VAAPPTTLLRIWVPLGALNEQSWIQKLDRFAMAGETKDSDLPLHTPAHSRSHANNVSTPQKYCWGWNIVRLKRKTREFRSRIDVGCWARHRTRIGSSAIIWQPFSNPAQDWNLIGRLKRTKSWTPKLDRCAMVGEAKDSDWLLPTPTHLPSQALVNNV
jgi:hypothetical protein